MVTAADKHRRDGLQHGVSQGPVGDFGLHKPPHAAQRAVLGGLGQGLSQIAHDPVRRGFHQGADYRDLAL